LIPFRFATKTFPVSVPPILLLGFAAARATLNAKLSRLAIDALAAIILPEELGTPPFGTTAGLIVSWGF
jgi:hypothetical protein